MELTNECFKRKKEKGNRRQESGVQTNISDFPTTHSFFDF